MRSSLGWDAAELQEDGSWSVVLCAATAIPCAAMLCGLVAFVQKPVCSTLGGSPAFLHFLICQI